MEERPMMSSFEPGTSTITFSGAVDELQVDVFRQQIVDASNGLIDGSLSIDLSDVDYLPSAAVSVLIKAIRPTPGVMAAEVVAAKGSIAQRVLHLSGLPHRTQ